MSIKLLVLYYSSTGVNTQLAEWAAEAGEDYGAEVRVRKAQELAPDQAIDSNPMWRKNVDATEHISEATSADLEWADSIIISSPSRFGGIASQMKQFLDTQGGLWAQGKLVNKFVTAMSSAGNLHGGQEEVIQSLYTVMQHWGAVIVPTGYANEVIYASGGNPYGTSATQRIDGQGMVDPEHIEPSVKFQTHRLLEVTEAYLKGMKELNK